MSKRAGIEPSPELLKAFDSIAALDLKPIGRPKKAVGEADVERAFCARVKLKGGTAYKFTSPARRSVPDRLVLMPGATAMFCELKAPGKKPSPEQQREHERLRALGFRVDVIDNLDAAKAWEP